MNQLPSCLCSFRWLLLAVAVLRVTIYPTQAQFNASAQLGGGAAGTMTTNAPGNYTVVMGGNDIWSGSDEFTFHHGRVYGDFDVKVRVESLAPNARSTKAGIMVRETPAGNSRMAFPRVTPPDVPTGSGGNGANDFRFGYRTDPLVATSGEHEDGGQVPVPYPNAWLRLRRSGSLMNGYYGTDGANWTLMGSQDTATWTGGALPEMLLLGVGGSRHSGGPTATAEFRDFSDTTPSANVGFTREPVSQTVLQGRPGTFTARVNSFYNPAWFNPAPIVTWFTNGIPVPGANDLNFTIASVPLAFSGMVVSVSVDDDGFGGAISSNAVLTVQADNSPPVLLSATADSPKNNRVRLVFNEALGANALSSSNYTVNGGLTVQSVVADGPNAVVVHTDSGIPEGTYTITYANVDDIQVPPNLASGSASYRNMIQVPRAIRFERFDGGYDINSIKVRAAQGNPDLASYSLPLWEYGPDMADYYGTWISGWIKAPATFPAQIWISSDDNSQAYASTDSDPANRVLAAYQNGYNGFRQWVQPDGGLPTPSGPIPVVAGEFYFVETFQQEGAGGDSVSLGLVPFGTPVNNGDNIVVASNVVWQFVISGLNGAAVVITTPPASATVVPGSPFTLSVAATTVNVPSGLLRYQWRKGGVEIPDAIASSYQVASAVPADSGLYDCVVRTLGDKVITAPASVTVAPNVAPSFVKGPDRVALLNSGPQAANAWATAISAGPPHENAQTLTFLVTNDNNALFFTQPAIAANGRLTFAPATNATGSALVSVRLQDNGGTNNGGVDTSAAQTFTISVVSNVPANGLSIVWVSDLLTNATTGRLPDENLVDLLKVNGHAVTRYNPPDAGAIPPADVALLNAADLVILGRSIGSAAFDTAAEAGAWNTNVTKPLLCMNGYLTRSNRLGWFTGNGIPDGLTSVLNFNNPADPVSTFILGNTPLTNNTTTNAIFQQIPLPAGGIDRGMSANTDAPVPGATPLAATLTPSNGQFLVSWPAGTVLTGVSTGQVLAGYRMQFLAGNREAAPGPDNTVASAGFNNLTVLGESLFLRAVLVAANGGVVGANWLGDSFGYRQSAAPYAFEDISSTGTRVLTNVDTITFTAPVGFNFNFYGRGYGNASFSAKGAITFGGAAGNYANANLTDTAPIGNLPGIAVLWDDWVTITNGNAGVDALYYQTLGSPGDRRFIVQWNNIFGYQTSPSGVTFQAILYEATGRILCQYLDVDSGNSRSSGAEATVGIRDTDGHLNGKNRLWSFNQAVITNGQAILFSPGLTEPLVTAQPQSRTNVAGTTATFTVGAAGLGTLAYQWQKNGLTLTNGGNVSGATTATLTLTNVAPGDAANYAVSVSNFSGRVVSAVATLTVVTPPVITAQPQSRTNVVGRSVTFSVTTTGTNPRFYQWQTNGISLPGATNTFYTATNIQLGASGTSFAVVVTNYGGSVTSAPAILTVTNATPPVIVAQPQSQNQSPGGSVTFSVTAAGSDPKSYQWSRNGAPIPGATGTDTAATNVQLSDDGALYTVVVTNYGGSVTSAPATLTVRLPGTFVVTTTNDSGPGSLRQVAGPEAVSGDTITFAPNLSGQTIRLTSGQITLGQSLNIDASALPDGVIIDGNANGRIFEVLAGSIVRLDSLTLTNGRASGHGGAIFNSGTLTVNRCTLVRNLVAVGGVGGGIYNSFGTLTLNQSTLAGNTATNVTTSEGGGAGLWNLGGSVVVNQCTFQGNNANNSLGGGGLVHNGGTMTVSQSTFTENTASPSVFNGGGILCAGTLTISNCVVAGNLAPANAEIFRPSGTLTFLGVNLTNGAPLLAPLGRYGGPTPTMPPLFGSPAMDGCTNGTTFTTDQRGFTRPVGPFADIGAAEAQTFTASPLTPLTVQAGASATFSTTVSSLPAGEPPVAYQWTKNSVAVPGASGSTLTVFPAAAADNGTYCVIASSLSHRVTNCATLTVEAPLPLVNAGGPWKYLADGSDQGTAWRGTNFNDAAWSNGVARLGFGGDGEATTIANAASNFVTFYFRQSFTVANAAAVSNLFGQIQVDDGVILYLNGTEIYRRNMTNDATTLNHRSLATVTVSAADEQTFWTFTTNSLALVSGVNVLAAEVHQAATNSSDLGFNLDLVGNYNGTLPPVIIVTSPTNAVPYNAAGIPLLVNARDPEGTVTNVDFYVDGAMVSRATNAPFSGVWLTPALGAHFVQAVATDNTGLSAVSQNQPFSVLTPSVLTTLVNSNSTWRYLDDGSDQGVLWRTNSYNDTGWSNGVAEFGYGDGPALPEATVIRNTGTNGQRIITTYFRKNFNVANPANYSNLVVRLRRDDGGVVYLNGLEVFRSNMTNGPGVPVIFTNLALNAADEVSFFSTNAPASLLLPGDNLVAVEIHQTTPGSSDVSFDLQLQAESGPLIFISQTNDVVTLNWLPSVPGLELQHAPTPLGPWTLAPNQLNPQSFTPNPADLPTFWRLRIP
jgi:hypothetical protein